jgi:hypothetical protein
VRRNLKRSTLWDYRQALDAYLLPTPAGVVREPTRYGRAPFATMPLRDPTPDVLKAWHDELPHGRTAEMLLMIVRAILEHGRKRDWIDADPAAEVERMPVRYSGDYDFFDREELDALVSAAASEQDVDLPGTREEVEALDVFREPFRRAKERVEAMEVRYVRCDDPELRTVFDVYAAERLGTKTYNTFETH